MLTLTNKKIKTFLLSLTLAFSFFLGITVSHYQIFPYPQLQSLKQIFFPVAEWTEYQNKYRQRTISKHSLLSDTAFDAVFVGDSITAEANWSELYPELNVANLGINADTTQGLLQRINTVKAITAPKVFLMIGINDILQGVAIEETEQNYERLVELLKHNNNQVYLFSCLYLGKDYQEPSVDEYSDKITRLNDFIKALENRIENVVYIDLNASLSSNLQLKSAYTNDDLHLNGNAYRIWKDLIDQHIK